MTPSVRSCHFGVTMPQFACGPRSRRGDETDRSKGKLVFLPKNLVLVLDCLFFVFPSRADVTNTIPASANAYVLRSSASTDQSEAQTLVTKRLDDSNTRIAYARFNINSFLSGNSVANLTSARLRLYYTGGSSDTVKVYGLLDYNANGVSDGAWNGSMTWNSQPAKTASPNDIPGNTGALPNANTTAQLGSKSFSTNAGEVAISLSLVDLQQLLLADTNQFVTLLFHNTGNNNINWASMANTSGFLVPTLELVATPSGGPAALLTWDGTLNGNWDTNTANWKTNPASPSTVYRQADEVTFDDSKSGASTVNLTLPVTPSRITISNSIANYTFSGSGRLSGIAGFSKKSGGTLTVSTSNDFNGPVIVSGGTLKAGSSNALGTAAGVTVVTNGATLDINGISLVSEPISVSGAGLNTNGVIINTGAQQTSALRAVTLLGDATFGGSGRWDIRNTGGNASLDTLGQPRKLTKVGANQFSLVGVAVDSKLGNIEVRQGTFSVETSTTGLGDPAYTLSVSNGATLQLYQLTATPNKNILLAGGAAVYNNSGANRISGAFTLSGNATFNVGGTSLLLNDGIGGTGGLTKIGTSTLSITSASTYTGGTTLSAGKLVINGFPGGTLTTASGTTLAGTFTNNGTATVSGSLLPGDANGAGVIAASSLTLNSGATVMLELLPGSSDLLQVTGNLMLNNNTLTILPLATLQTNVPYRLVNYSGALSGTFNPVLNLDTNFTASLDYSTPGQINLIFSRVLTFTIPTVYPIGPGPTTITVGADGKLIYWPDTNGDTIPDFSSAGYRGGGVEIPTNIPIITTLSPIAGDNQPQIQGALDALESLPIGMNGFRGVVYLNPGVYTVSNGLTFNASGVVLRGAGWGTNGTILRLLQSGRAITIVNASGVSRSEVPGTRHNITTTYVPLGARWFTVDSVSGWSVGDNVMIHRPSTAGWLTALYPPGGKSSWVGAVDVDWHRIIVAIEGNRVMLDAPLMQSIDQQYGGAYVYKFTYNGRTENVGIEDIRADCISGVDTNGNTSGQLANVDGVQNCWIRRCMNDRMSGHTITASGSRWCTFEDIISFHNPLPGGHTGASTGINGFDFGSQGLLFHRFTSSDGGFEWCSWNVAAGPNVFLECDIPHGFAFSGPHMKWAVGTLYDAVFQHHGLSVLLNDGSHGWAGGNHMAWNVEAHGIEFDRPPTAHQWVHGVISTSTDLGDVRSGALPTEVLSWQSHIDPRSLYRAQLAERLGAQKVLAALGQPYAANLFLVTPATNTASTAPGQNIAFPVVLTVMKNYPDATVIPNVAGSVTVPNWPNSNVVFSVSGLPFGCAATFDSASLNVAGTNLLNITASNNAPAGNYLVTVEGSSAFPNIRGAVSPLNQSATVILNVTGTNSFSVSAEPYSQAVDPGTNTSFTVKVTGTNGFSGNVPLSVLGLPVGVIATFNPPSVNGSGSSTLTLTASNNAPPGLYTLTIIGTNAGLAAGATVKLGIGLTAGLPAPWDNADIGSPTLAGSAAWTNDTFTLKGCGADIWGTSDQFQFAWQEQAGDFTLTARVASQSNTDPWAKAGVMLRESTNANSEYIALYVTPTSSHGVSLQYRPSTGGSAVDALQVSGPTVPYWVRLVRSGNTISAWRSSDGLSWTQAGTNITALNLASNLLVGLAVCSHDTAALGTVTFDNVSVVQPTFVVSTSPLSQTVIGGDDAAFTSTVAATNNFVGVVTLSVDGLPPGATGVFTPPVITNSGSSTLTITTTNTTVPDDYELVITGISGSLQDQSSATLTVTPADTDADGLPDYWTLQHFGHITSQPGDLSGPNDDPDNDHMSNLKEYLSGTDPNNPQSYLHLISATPVASGDDVLVTWLAVAGKTYVIETTTDLSAPNPFTDASPSLDVTGTGESVSSFLHSNAATNTTRFYRVRVEQ